MTTALVYDPAYLKHETGHHPENPQRLKVIISASNKTIVVGQASASGAPAGYR